MDRPIGKVERNNHLNHLTKILPFVAVVFGLQCYLIYQISSGIDIGNYTFFLGVSLASFVGALLYYDTNHHIIIYQNRLHIYFQIMGVNEEVYFTDIQEMYVPEEDINFSTMVIKTHDDKKYKLHFIDHPYHVKKFILDLMDGKDMQDDIKEAA